VLRSPVWSRHQHADTTIERLSKRWDAPVYAFFKPYPTIEYFDGRKAHVFECAVGRCRCKSKFVRRFLYTGDTSSTSNLRRHAKLCWGDEVVAAADTTGNLAVARSAMSKQKGANGLITAAFDKEKKGGKPTYSYRQHTKVEARYVRTVRPPWMVHEMIWFRAEFVRWVSVNKRPFQIVNDEPFRSLMKTGRPECYIPSAETLSRDVKTVFVSVREGIAKMLRVSL
jgi:hypothetical protein